MENENILMQMVKDNMLLTLVDPRDYSEFEGHIEGRSGNFHLVDETGELKLPIRRLLVPSSSEFLILCNGVDDYFEVIGIN